MRRPASALVPDKQRARAVVRGFDDSIIVTFRPARPCAVCSKTARSGFIQTKIGEVESEWRSS